MDFKKLAGQAGQLLTRAVQYTEEKLGNAEKTEFDGHYDLLITQYEQTKMWTERMMNGAQSVLIPNPGNRVEDMLFEKIERKRPNRLSNFEYLGLDMVQAGNEFGPGSAYGSALLKVGGAEQRLGLIERSLISNGYEGFVQPLHKFLDTEIKTIARERRVLDTKRLDLDACKSKLRKARSIDAQVADNVDPKVLVAQAESELRKAQIEFDRQTEITKLLLEGVRSSQASHLQYLNELVEAQAQYYEKSHTVMMELQEELASVTVSENSSETNAFVEPSSKVKVDDNLSVDLNWKKAKVVCDYDATSKEEISLKMNEEVCFQTIDETAEFVSVKKGGTIGKVPRAYLEVLE